MKMYVILMNYYNGLTYEELDAEHGVFCGIFSTCERAKKMVEALCRKRLPHLADEFLINDEVDSPIQMITETPDEPEVISRTTIKFETYCGSGSGFVEYEIVEREVDQEIKEWR